VSVNTRFQITQRIVLGLGTAPWRPVLKCRWNNGRVTETGSPLLTNVSHTNTRCTTGQVSIATEVANPEKKNADHLPPPGPTYWVLAIQKMSGSRGSLCATWCTRKLSIIIQNGANENCRSIYMMVQKKISYQYTTWCKRKFLINIHDGAKKIAYQYTTWCKRKLPISIQNGAKENCLPIYNMVQNKTSHRYTEWCKRKLPTNIQHGAKQKFSSI